MKTKQQQGKQLIPTKQKQGKYLRIWNNNRMSSSSSSCCFLTSKNHRLTSCKTSFKHSKERRTRTTISDLPGEVLTEVLVRLSVKDVLACVCVQKSWHSLIKTHMFITLHSIYHQNISSSSKPNNNNNNNKYLFFWDTYTDAFEIRVDDDIQCQKYLTLKYPPGLSHLSLFQLVSNGLICLFDYPSTTIHLWNPVIQKYKTLLHSRHPPYSHRRTQWEAIAFGFVPQTNDYLVVYMIKYRLRDKPRTHSIMTCVYSLNTNSWIKITHDSIPVDYISQCSSVFVNGVAIWAGGNYAQGERVLVCFDTKTEMLRVILLPELRCFPVIHAFDQSIASFVEDYTRRQLGVWVLKGDPMNEYLWEKKMMVEMHEDVEVSVKGVTNNGEPILLKNYDLISYNLDSHKSYDFVKSLDSWIPSSFSDDDRKYKYRLVPFMIKPFAESLGLLDIDCTKY